MAINVDKNKIRPTYQRIVQSYAHKLIYVLTLSALFLLITGYSSKAVPELSHAVISPINVIELGNGWATNTINTVIFRHHGILSRDNKQFTAFYTAEGKLRFIARDLITGQIGVFDLPGDYNMYDAHNSISIGIDRQGYLHVSYDQHGGSLRYRRSKVPLVIDQWTDELPMTGLNENRVTYPAFISDAQRPLLFLYREGQSGSGDAYLKEYDEISEKWRDRGCILKGTGQSPWTSSPYWNHPAIDDEGRLHLSFVWRTHSIGDQKLINNINVDYALSDDWGQTWYSSNRQELRLPITQVNSESILAVSPGMNLINQTSSAVDSHGYPHIVFYANDPDGIPQYQHLWFDGKEWHRNYISHRKEPFKLEGGGTLQIPISRPEIVIDADDNVYVVYRGDLTAQRMAVQRLFAPDYRPFGEIGILWDDPVEFAEPVIDRLRWKNEGILSMLIQKNGQPPHDGEFPVRVEPVYIIDWDLQGGW